MTQHVYPAEQENLHNLESPDCYCEPQVLDDAYKGRIWVHQLLRKDYMFRFKWWSFIRQNSWMGKLVDSI